MPDNRYYYFKDAKGNRHTVNKTAFDNDREGFAKAFPGARMEVIDRKTGRRGDVDVKDAGRVGDFGAHLFTGQTVRREKYQPKTSLGKAAQSVAQEKWGGKDSALVKGLREADALKRRDEEQMPIDYTKPSAVKQMVGRTRREQQTLDRRIEQAGREAGKEVQGEIRRKNSPAFDLGNEDVNNNLVKTRGQLEKDMEKSGSKFVDDEFSKYISDVFKKEDEAAFERGQNAALNVIASSPSNAVFGTTRARNEEMSPEKRLANITKEIEGNIHNLFSSSNVAERIKAEATKLGVSPDDYVEHTLVPSLMNKVSSDFDKTELKSLLPSGAIETILMHTQNSMTGALASMGLMTKSQRQYGQRALSETLEGNNPKYNPGLGTRVAGSTLSFMMDMTPIGMAEKPAAAVAGKLFGNGVAQTARIANSTLGGRIARMAGSGMVSQGITGVLYGSTNAAVQNYSTGDDTSIGNTVKVMAMGGLSEGASWATMGGIGGVVGAGIYNVSGVKRIPAKAFQLAMEGIGMHMGGNVAKTIEGHDTDWTSIEGNLEACANVVALKLTHARLPKRQVKDGVKESYLDVVARNINGLMTSDGQRAAFGGYTFTNEEKEQLFGSASAPKRNESIYGYDAHDNPLTRKESLTSWAMRTKKTAAKGKGEESHKDTDAEFVKTAYDEIMADNTIPWDTKAKFSALVMGTVPSARPMMENCRIEGNSVNEYSKNGELLSKNSFKNIDERNSIIYSLNMKREDQRLSNAYGAAQIKDEKTAQATLEAVAEANGMTAEQLKTAMDKQPLRRSEEEQNACVALRKAYEDEQFVPGTLHAEQSNTEGKDVVEENNLGTENPNNEAVAKVLGDLTKAEDALQAAMDGNDVLKEEYERMQKAGMSNPQIYMELFNSGLTQEQLAPLADYINALSKAQGMFKGTQDKIVETTQKHVGQWSYKGELNGEKQNGEQMMFVKDNKGRVLIVGAGDVAFDGEGRVRDGDMLTVYDPATREMDFVHAKDVTLERTASSEEYAKDYQRQLEELNSTVYAEMQQQDGKPNEASPSLPKPGEQPKGKAPKPEGEEAKSDTDMYKPGTDPLLFTVEKNGRAEQYDVTPHIKVNNEGGKIITFSGVTTFVKGAPKGHNEGETRNRPNGVAFIRINPDNIDYERYVYEDAKEQDGTPMKKEDVTEEDIAEAKEDIDFIFNRAGTGPVYNILKIIVTPDGRVYGETVDGYVVPLKKNPLESSDKYKESLNKKPVPTFADGTPVPMIKDSKNRETADYSQMSPEQGAEWMSSQFGENAEAAVDGQIKRAEKTLKGAEKIKVDYTGDLNDAKEAEAQKKIAIEAAKAELELYTNIKKAMTEKKVKAGMEKASSVGGVGEVGRVGVAREKFESGLRVVGNKRTRTLADGSKLRGHYEIVDADSLTPSHNANDGYKKSEGFPVNEEGRTINDRDYENDKQAQLVTDMIAMKYDGQAVDQVPVVTSDGIVVDGNGRTMAGQKAAKDGTDGAYLEALKENAENYGFTAEQIEQSGIKHPRLVLVSDEPMKYDTATFAKFNKNEKKAQGNTQQAVANSKKLSADEIGTIISEIEGSGSLDAFFNNPSAINSLLTRLVDKGVIGLNEVAGLREGEDKLSAAGKDFVKNLLLGSVFSENTIRMMGADAMLKTKALNGIRAVTDNMKLGDYALMKEIDQAVQLLYEARQGGSGVDAYLRTPAMFGENAADRFDPISQAIALALEGKAEDFRELMMAYNRNAAPYADASQTEMFGERPTKEDFVNEFLKLRNWKNYETRHSSKEGNGDAGSSEGTEPQAPGGSEPTEGQREVNKTQRTNTTRDPLVETTKAAFEQSKAEYLKALKEGKTGKELENAELHYKFSFLDYQNVMGVTDAESLEKLWKREFESAKTSETEPSEASLGLPKPGEQPGEKSEGAKPVGDGKEPKANPLDGMRKAAELFKDEQITKARAELAEAKKSGDASEVKRLTDKLKGLMDSTLRGKGIGLVERRKIIGEELGKAEAEKIDKPWADMEFDEQVAETEKKPLDADEIKNSDCDGVDKANAVAYLNGDKNIINTLSYLTVYDNVRNRERDSVPSSGTEDGTQLDAADNAGGEGLGRTDSRPQGVGSGQLGRTEGDGNPERGESVQPGERVSGGESGKVHAATAVGEQGGEQVHGGASGVEPVSAGGAKPRGSRGVRGEGRDVRERGNEGSGNFSDEKAGEATGGRGIDSRNLSTVEQIDKEISDTQSLVDDLFNSLFDGRTKGSIISDRTNASIIPLASDHLLGKLGINKQKMAVYKQLIPALTKLGYLHIKKGVVKLNDWIDAMKGSFGGHLTKLGLSDEEVYDYIKNMWNSNIEVDGVTHKLSEWASILGTERMKKEIATPNAEKYKRQVAAEPIKVKIGDKKNIEETLPYLLPQQQEDVLRAETQFFGNEHADREHAYGKGYMFTNGTGTGKTFTGLGVAKRLVKQGKGRILIVTPSQKKVSDWIKDGHNLNMEIRDLDSIAKERGTTATTESGEGVVITTFANFGVNKKLLETKWDAVIYDESHRIMENKNGTETARSMQHYMVTNRSENHCFLRLQETNKDYQKMKSLGERFDAERGKEVKRIQDEYKASHPSATPRDVAYATSRMLPKERNGFTPGDYASFPKLGKIHAEFVKALSHYTNEVEPKLKAQAKNEWKDTKTIFLSATPFNTRENLDYAEGYIFKYPEVEKGGRISGRTQFYLDHFGAAYKFRYNRLEQSTSNPEAVAKQEIEFSDYLQDTLGTMSGRIIDSPYDYSRDFPTVSPDHAEEFNQAVQDAVRGHGVLAYAYRRTIGDYNYGSALFETMKVANIIERIKAHLDAGRKVVIFHRRVETKEPLKPPFAYLLEQANRSIVLMKPGEEKKKAIQAVKDFRKKYADLLEWEQTLDYSMPREQIAKVFGKDKVLFFSGKESTKAKDKAVDTFNSDDSGKNIIVIQEASGKEGISLHDTTGKHQRVCITLALPQSPITALQIEGRTYRIGNKSNAIFEYPILGLNSEMMLFGQKFNNQVSTTENLALGSKARSLRDSFANGILEHSGVVPIDQQGVGGKEFDAPKDQSTDGFDNAVLDYYSNQKLNSRNREGVDYFPTPEPLGYKMMEWANMGEGDTVLEPSAGHGAIARYAPKGNQMVAIEPSQSLFTKLQLKAGGLGRKFQNTIFENYDISNKHDVVVMNPPFGTAGATAIAHLGKAFKHLEEGGRVVALIPRGSTDKKFEKWIEGEKTAVMRAEVELPDIVFEQAGTKVVCRVVVVDKISNEAMRAKAGSVEKWDLGGHYDKIEDFFEDLRDVGMPDRIIDTNAIMMKKSKQTVKDLKELKDARVDFNEGGINVRVRGDWKDYSIPFDMEGYNAEQKKKFLASTYETFEQQERQTRNETSQAVLAELKKLTCKLADMTEEEMQRYLKKKYEGKGVMYRIEHAAEVYNKAKGDASLGLSKPTEPLEGRIAETVEKVSKQTGGKVKMVNSVEEIGNEQVRRDIENGKQVTGWYDENTGEVRLYMPNIHDSYTAEKTVWHETVGHEGMRGLLGDKFNDYMRGLWMDLDNPMNAELRVYVKERMSKDSMGFYDAIEEFIAESAEKGKGEPGFWNNIKNKVTDALHEIGYRISPNVKDVKYMLWLAKNVQKKGNDPWWKMRADAVKWKIEHENVEYTKIHGGEFYENDGKNHDFEDMTKEEWDEATDGQIHYRTAPSAATALDRYHSMLNAHGYMATEAFMDNMLSLEKLMKAVDPSIKKIEDVKSSMNPYVLQNTMQGAMSDKMTLFEHQVMKPLDKAMSDVLDSFAGKNTEEKIRECNLYMIGKHGLERNRVLFVRDKIREKRKVKSEESDSIDALEAAWNGEKNDLGQKLRSGQIDLREYYRQMDEWIVQNIDKDFKAEEHDYSGMHGLQEIDDLKSPYDDAGAIDSVMSQEAKMENQKKGSVDNLWNRIKDATNYSINSDYENGLMSEELRDRVASMFDWYVPLRKFDEATAEDVYGYISGEDGKGFIGETLMNAKGRKSLSDVNVLAQIGAMANRAIRNGGQNAVKQAFARFVRNSGEQNLVKETKVWVEKKGTDMNGNDIWEEAYPQIPDNASAHDIATIVDAFETDMKTKQAKGEAKTLSNSTDIGFKFARAKNKSEHFVDVKIAGRTHSFVVLGNPRAAQALNGMLENSSPNSALLKGLKSTTRFMAQMATSYSPEFVMRNIIRDAEFASSNVTAKEGVMYGKKWLRYYAELNPLNVAYNEGAGALKSLKWRDLKEGVGMGLYARYREGTLGNSKMERYFKEFMQNGGETGWVQVKTMQEWEKEYKRDVSREHSKVAKTGKALRDFLVGNVENLNEVAENMARFATFCTSRDLGRSAVRSAYDAKQVSTNFNRHGSGDAIKTFKNGEMGAGKEMRRNVYGFIASYLRNYSMFFNAGVQSTHLLMNNVKKAPVGTIASMMAMPFGLGILAAAVNNAMIANEDEKERKGVQDPYGELPEYIRRNNLCIYKGGGEFVTIPLAIELRAFYGLGDIAAGMTTAKNVKSTRNVAMDAVGCMSQLLPVVDFTNTSAFDKEPGKETLKGVLPTAAAPFVEWWLNSDWKGTPIRREGDYTENRPAWMNAYSGTPEKLMDLNKWVNARTNDVAPGNENMRGNSLLDEATDPAMLNHIIGTLGGGAATFITRGTGLVLKYADGREQEIETKDIPFLRSLMYTPSEQTSMARTKAKWYGYKESMEKGTSNYSMLKNKNVPLTERIRNAADRHRFEQSADYARIRIIKDAEKQMKRWNKMKRLNADDKKQVDFANKNIEMIMQKAVEHMDGISDD